MKEIKKTITQCGKCNRAVYTTDVDARGMCCFCKSIESADFEKLDHPMPVVLHGSENVVPKPKRGRKL